MSNDHDCSQQRTIGNIEATLESLRQELIRHGEREDRMLTALEVVAAQGETIKFLVNDNAALKRDVNLLFARERKRPLAIRVLESKYGIYVIGMIVLGFIMDVTQHYQAMKMWLSLAK